MSEQEMLKDNPIVKQKKKSKIGKILSNNIFCIAAGCFAAFIMIFVYMAYKFFPIGSTTILRMDLYHQYGPLFTEFYERVFNADSFLYSWCSGGGSSFIGNYFNYLSSPSNIIMLIFGHKNMPEAIAAMILLKNAAAAFGFAYFIKNYFGKNDITISGFGVLYAFCGFYMAYYWNIMWLDGMVALPFVILGIIKIIDQKGSPLMYCAALAFVMMTSYYMAYMICIVSVIFFIYYYFSNYEIGATNSNLGISLTKKQYARLPSKAKLKIFYKNCLNSRFFTKGVTFAFYSFVAFAIAAFSLIPVYFVLKTSSATGSSFPESAKFYFKIFDFLANHLAGAEPTIRSSGEDVIPNVYTGILPLILAPLYLFSKKYTFKEKVASSILYAVFFFSFNINSLNFIWHGFHFPNDLPYRWSFAYSFFLLFFAYKALVCIKEYKPKQIGLMAIGISAFAVFAQKIGSKNVDDTVVIETIAFAFVYAVILMMFGNKKYVKSAIAALLCCAMCIEVIVVDTDNFQMTQAKENYVSKYDDFVDMKAEVDELEGENSFYRMELSKLLARMDPCWYYYNGVSVFSSMAYESMAKLQKKLGMFGNDVNSYTYYPQTPIYNAMYSIKYVFDAENLIHSDKTYTKITSGEKFKVYKNNYYLPLAYAVSDELSYNWTATDSNPFKNHENFFKYATGVNGVFVTPKIEVKALSNLGAISAPDFDDGVVSFNKTTYNSYASIDLGLKSEVSGNMYLYVSGTGLSNAVIDAADNAFSSDPASPYVLDLGYVEANSEVSVQIELSDEEKGNNGSFNFYAATIDMDKFEEGYNKILKNGTLEITEFDNGAHVAGKITVAEDMMLYTSIPYDEGWTVTLDGVKLTADDYYALADSMLCLDITAGEHTISFDYMPKGLLLGTAVSAISIILLALCIFLRKKKKLIFADKFTSKIRIADFDPMDYLYTEEELAAEFDFETFESPDDETSETAGESETPVDFETAGETEAAEDTEQVKTEDLNDNTDITE